jgi:hypothetical protein
MDPSCGSHDAGRHSAVDFGVFEDSIAVQADDCPHIYSRARASQRSTIDAHRIEVFASGSGEYYAPFGWTGASAVARIAFRIESPEPCSYSLEGETEIFSDYMAYTFSVELRNREGVLDSYRLSSYGDRGVLRTGGMRAEGMLYPAEYEIEVFLQVVASIGVRACGWARCTVHLDVRNPTAVEAMRWQEVKALFR